MNKLILPFLLIVTWGCSHQKTDQIPEQFQELENLTVYSTDPAPAKTISFKKNAVYGDSGEVLIGELGEVAVDRLGRVFMADVGKMVIYVFESDGQFIGQLGRDGSGPGEFSSYLKNLQIRGNRLYAFDPSPHRLQVFTLDNLTIETTVSLAGNRSSYQELARAFPWIRNVFVRKDETYIAEFVMHATQEIPQRYQNIELQSLYYLLDSEGSISKELHEFTSAIITDLGIVFNIKEFFGHVLQGFSSNDLIYLAEPDFFLVKTYSPDGAYQGAFFYPLRKMPLTRETAIEAGVSDRYIDLMESVVLPETWPVLTEMIIDDQDRLWIATTVEDMNVYEWWVLEGTGELITRFEWPRDEPIEVVNNGYMYTRETDEETGLQSIVRYRIEMKEV